MNRVRELVGASEIYRMGYDGTGIGVAVLDSGEPQHPDLNGRMVRTEQVSELRYWIREWTHSILI